uniref:Uncharacterized protein n=1 Tax=viral metagenome TaxID=1070528 RepID=A0A6C0DPK5_9ZZZZ
MLFVLMPLINKLDELILPLTFKLYEAALVVPIAIF